ncbi:MAG: hypothetical protein KBF76_03810 [Verrucomicrobiales bacterium]|nr:hypothetical protein [Verrucomicrobiales bacterium]
MKPEFKPLRNLLFAALVATSTIGANAEEEAFEYKVGEFDPITGDGANIGGFIFPEVFQNLTGGAFEPGRTAADLATSEHDPKNEFGVQSIEVHLNIDLNDVVTGAVYGAGVQGANEWEANLEEAYLHYHFNDQIAVGGGQFLNTFGFQSEKHLHAWDFINQNLVNSRMLNEGELITQGGEAVFMIPGLNSITTIGGGGVRAHDHDHEHGEEEFGHEEEIGGHHDEHDHEEEHGHEEEEHGHEEDEHAHEEEDHHLEADDANFSDWVLTADWKTKLPFDESATASASVAAGENGFGHMTYAYGVGLEKIWGAHDHGNGPEFCSGAVMLRSEFIGRHIGVAGEDGERFNADDYGFSTALAYGLSDTTTMAIRHDWVSELEEFDVEERHRISSALTTFLDKNQRIRARVQYDYNHSASYGDEHTGWLQIQIEWGGHGGGGAHHHH